MKYKLVLNFVFVVIAVIVGAAAAKQFDSERLTFDNPALAVIYIIVFIACIIFMIKKKSK